MRVALSELDIEQLFVIYAGQHRFVLADRVEAVPAAQALMPGGLEL
jgi:hypothetical protein